MDRIRRVITGTVLVILALVLAACNAPGGGENNADAGDSAPSSTNVLNVETDGEQLAYVEKTLSVDSGQSVTVIFKNNSVAQQHNWVLVSGGDEVATQVDKAGAAAGTANNYLPTDTSDIVAASKLLNPGENTEVTFTAPSPGSYLYICTVPGHYPLMQGVLIIN